MEFVRKGDMYTHSALPMHFIMLGCWEGVVLLEQRVYCQLDPWQCQWDPAHHVPISLQELKDSLEQVKYCFVVVLVYCSILWLYRETNLHFHLGFLRTIHGLVFNALKLFMDVTPQLFDECTNQYRQARQKYVDFYYFLKRRFPKNTDPAFLLLFIDCCLFVVVCRSQSH